MRAIIVFIFIMLIFGAIGISQGGLKPGPHTCVTASGAYPC